MTRNLNWPLTKRPLAVAFPLAILANSILAEDASAHVKWFCAYDVAGQPRALANVICLDFELLIALSLVGLIFGVLLELGPLGPPMLRAMDRVTGSLRKDTELIFRIGCGFFFVSIWAVGGILLTPELKIDSTWVGAIQLGIAASMLSRRTMPLGAIGIVVLFALAVWRYGVFHLADYPVFLGVAGYVALTGLRRDLFGIRPIDFVRWTASITLLWASVEKWAYPEWSYPLFIEHPNMTLGFDPEFFMRAAGAVEFALAFALLWTPLLRRSAAIILTGMFISAVFQFGKIDLIGHTLIVVVLLAVAADNGGKPAEMRYSLLLPIGYAAALCGFLATYYASHALLYGVSAT